MLRKSKCWELPTKFLSSKPPSLKFLKITPTGHAAAKTHHLSTTIQRVNDYDLKFWAGEHNENVAGPGLIKGI